MDRANFSQEVSEILMRNKTAILQRVSAATPHEGFVPFLAHIAGLDAVVERAEERTYDAVVGIINSKEVDSAIRERVISTFSRMHDEIGRQDWKQHLGIKPRII